MKTTMNRATIFKTSDLDLASFLVAKNFKLQDIIRTDRCYFVFTNSADLHSAMVAYANDDHVKVRSFLRNLRDLKALTK